MACADLATIEAQCADIGIGGTNARFWIANASDFASISITDAVYPTPVFPGTPIVSNFEFLPTFSGVEVNARENTTGVVSTLNGGDRAGLTAMNYTVTFTFSLAGLNAELIEKVRRMVVSNGLVVLAQARSGAYKTALANETEYPLYLYGDKTNYLTVSANESGLGADKATLPGSSITISGILPYPALEVRPDLTTAPFTGTTPLAAFITKFIT